MTMPWLYYHGFKATREQNIEGMERFARDVVVPLSSRTS
jgi:hypothetical protein